MQSSNKLYLAAGLICLGIISTPPQADDEISARITKQMAVEDRHEFDGPKDAGRKPVEAFAFMGVESGMVVMDVGTGAGYTAELLSAAVGPAGHVYAQTQERATRLQDGYFHKAMMSRLSDGRLGNVAYLIQNLEDIGVADEFDMVHWGFNLHDYYNRNGKDFVVGVLANIHTAMKPGAVLIVSDHVGLDGKDNEALHRITQDDLTDVITDAGFSIEGVSDLLRNPSDDHSLNVFEDAIYRQTDRVIVRARKQESIE
jgi:predicted methyltransferase